MATNPATHGEYFAKLIRSGLTPCIGVAACKEGRTIFEYYGGRAVPDDPRSATLTAATRMTPASVTKVITGALMCKLADEGELVLEDKVQRFIPEYPFDDVTVLNLMTHTAGYASDQAKGIARPMTVDKLADYLKALYAIKERPNKPWETSAYFTQGYTMVLDMIERIAGQPIADFARTNLFEPCGMTLTSYAHADVPREQAIMPYNYGEKRLMNEIFAAPPHGDAGIFTTAGDLAKFGAMILEGGAAGGRQVFSEACAECMLRECTGGRFHKTPIFFYRGEQDTYHCFGDLASPGAAGHTGAFGCMMMVDPASGVAAAITTNSPQVQDDWKNYGRILNRVMAQA